MDNAPHVIMMRLIHSRAPKRCSKRLLGAGLFFVGYVALEVPSP